MPEGLLVARAQFMCPCRCANHATDSLLSSIHVLIVLYRSVVGNAIAQMLVQQEFFKRSRRTGIYIHCSKLREVDTTQILQAAMQQGKRCYVPLVDDKASNMCLLHLDSMNGLTPAPPFNILEPKREYDDGSPREDGEPLFLLKSCSSCTTYAHAALFGPICALCTHYTHHLSGNQKLI